MRLLSAAQTAYTVEQLRQWAQRYVEGDEARIPPDIKAIFDAVWDAGRDWGFAEAQDTVSEWYKPD